MTSRRSSKRMLKTLAALLVLGVVATGCGSSSKSSGSQATSPTTAEVSPSGDIPDNQAFVAYQSSAGHYGFKVPEGWARSESGSAVTFTDKLNAIHAEIAPSSAAPTTSSVMQNDVPQIQSANKGVTKPTVSSVSRKGGTAILLKYTVDGAPDAVTGKSVRNDVERYVFWKGGTQAILTMTSPAGADNVDPWKIVTDSFTWQ